MTATDNILREALTLKPSEKAQLIDKLLSILDKPDKEIDELWAKEAEDRINGYEQGKIKAISLEKVLKNTGRGKMKINWSWQSRIFTGNRTFGRVGYELPNISLERMLIPLRFIRTSQAGRSAKAKQH